MFLTHVGQSMRDQVYHEPPSLYSILDVWNSRPIPYSIAISDLKSTLRVLIHLCLGKTSSWRAFVISWWCIC